MSGRVSVLVLSSSCTFSSAVRISINTSKDQILVKSQLGEASEPAVPIFHSTEIMHTAEGTIVAHALEGSSVLSRCGPKFPPPPPEREEKGTG